MATKTNTGLSRKAITERSASSRGEYRDGKVYFSGPMARLRAEAFATVLKSYGEPAGLTVALDSAVVTTRYARVRAGAVKRVKPVVDDITRSLDRARKVQASQTAGTVRSYEVEFVRPLWKKRRDRLTGKVEILEGDYGRARWDTVRTVKTTAANAAAAFEQVCRSTPGGLRPTYKAFAYAVVRPAASSNYRPDQARDFGDFYAYRSVTDNKWACHKGNPGESVMAECGNYDDC